MKEIIDRGIPMNKLVLGKPVTSSDAANTGTVAHDDLGAWTLQAYHQFGWYSGIMFWQLKNDVDFTAIQKCIGDVKDLYYADNGITD